MAAPNIVNVTTIVPHTVTLTPANTARQGLVAAPATGATHKINTVMIANLDPSNSYAATISLCLADGTTFRSIGNTVSVPPNSTLVLTDKSTSFYLLDTTVTGETSTLWVQSNSASNLTFTCSYETIS
jgi:hypothetical protein